MAETFQDSNIEFFKFKELRVYGSTEYLADNQKKYRQVFNRAETSYIYAEITLFNKLFDEQEWVITGELRCYEIKRGRRKICVIPVNKKVNKFDHLIYIREGWGNKNPGIFWKRGTYCWEFWIDDEKIGSKHFYIEDPTSDDVESDSPFLDLLSVKLYEGSYNDVNEEDRVYYRTFSAEDARYIYVEMTFRNNYAARSWHCELFTKFYNGARELKGQVVRLQTIDKDSEIIRISAGWGSNMQGSWRMDDYTAEIVFMDRLIAIVPFRVSDQFEEGIAGVLLPELQTPIVLAGEEKVTQSFEELMDYLEALIGLNAIKTKVKEHANYIKFLQLRKDRGFNEEAFPHVHSIFVGNPGTGKTTVAKMMGKLYNKMGLLSKGHVHEVDRVDLVGEYIGQTAPKVKEAIEKARGGVLFIDEAYSLSRSNEDNKDFGKEVIEILVKEMSNGPGDLAVIAAGYPKEMKNFLAANPGLKSRFKMIFEFNDYLPQELGQISQFACKQKMVTLDESAEKLIQQIIIDAYRDRDRTFGNARFVFDLIEKAKINLGLRIMAMDQPSELDEETLSRIELGDVEKIQVKSKPGLPLIPVDESQLEEAMQELNSLIGLEGVKQQINELISLVRYYRQTGKDVLNNFFLHTIFVGNPGTGKTTVARILVKIYKALGILERGQMVETDRQGLVAGYVGQTAIKTAEKIDEAMGGVLFIDEAYALTRSNYNGAGDFGMEAIQTLLKRMEDNRGAFFVFAAGYPDNMETFLKANPGLSSRFDKILKFEDYSPDELFQIAKVAFEEQAFQLSFEAEAFLLDRLNRLYERRDRYFGNARLVRGMVTEAIRRQNLRLSAKSMPKSIGKTSIIEVEDIKAVELSNNDLIFTKKTIGFTSYGKASS